MQNVDEGWNHMEERPHQEMKRLKAVQEDSPALQCIQVVV